MCCISADDITQHVCKFGKETILWGGGHLYGHLFQTSDKDVVAFKIPFCQKLFANYMG